MPMTVTSRSRRNWGTSPIESTSRANSYWNRGTFSEDIAIWSPRLSFEACRSGEIALGVTVGGTKYSITDSRALGKFFPRARTVIFSRRLRAKQISRPLRAFSILPELPILKGGTVSCLVVNLVIILCQGILFGSGIRPFDLIDS